MSILKNVVESMRDKERNAILEEDKRMAQNIFDRTKKAKTVDDEILTEKEEMKGTVVYVIEKKFMELEQAIKEAIAELENDQEVSGTFGQPVISSYNNLSLYLNKIAKYSTMNQNNKIKIDQRFEQINSILNDLIFSAGQNNVDVRDLQQMNEYISSKNYKTVGLDDASKNVLNQQFRKEEYVERGELLLANLRDRINEMTRQDIALNRQRGRQRQGRQVNPVLELARKQRDKLGRLFQKVKNINFNLKSNGPKIDNLFKTVEGEYAKLPPEIRQGLLPERRNNDEPMRNDDADMVVEEQDVDELLPEQDAMERYMENPININEADVIYNVQRPGEDMHARRRREHREEKENDRPPAYHALPHNFDEFVFSPNQLRRLEYDERKEDSDEEEHLPIGRRPAAGSEEAKEQMRRVREFRRKKKQ